MRIAMIAPPWLTVPPRSYGGTETVIDALARGLHRRGHDVVLLAHPDSTCPVARVTLPRVGPDTLMGDGMHEARHVLAAHDHIDDAALDDHRAFDVVHDHTVLGPLVRGDHEGPPFVTTNHGLFDDTTVPVFRRIAERAAVVAISHAQAAEADGVPIAGVVHHGVEVAEHPAGEGGGDVLFLGRMAPTKGVVEAIRLARTAGMRLVLAAKMREPAEHAYYTERVRPLLGDDAVYVGEVEHDDKLALLGQATALLNPIRWSEPFGMVMLEAIACGTPVVAFAAGAAPEIVEHGVSGFVCRSDAEIVQGLRRAASLDRAACRARAAECFSVDRMVDGHLAVYRAAIDRRPR